MKVLPAAPQAALSRRLVLGAALASTTAPLSAFAVAGRRPHQQSIDVCCNANSLRIAGPSGPNPDDPGGEGVFPYYGASFVVQGVIYPAGFLAEHGLDSGLNADGSPEFEALVLGGWICRGFFIGDSNGDGAITPDDEDARGGIFTPTGQFVATTQLYNFDATRRATKRTLVSDGVELIDLDVPFARPVTGGTGRFAGASGQVIQTAVGANATGLFNFEFDFELGRRFNLGLPGRRALRRRLEPAAPA